MPSSPSALLARALRSLAQRVEQRPPAPAPGAPDPAAPPAHGDHLDLAALAGLDPHAPVVQCRLYQDGRALPVDDLAAALRSARRRGGFVWIGLHGPSAADVAQLARPFGLPAAAVADAVAAHQRPKFQVHAGAAFAVVKPVRYVDPREVVDVSEIAVFTGDTFVITVRHGESGIPAAVRAELEADPAAALAGSAVVLRRTVELAISGYEQVVDAIAVDVDEIEEQVFSGDTADHAQRIYKLKREVLEFKRAVAPLVVPVQRIPQALPLGTGTHWDVLDDLLRAAEAIEGYDSLLTDVLQAHLAQVGVQQNRVAVRQNEDMRKISAWAAIALVPTAVAGIYGMNFENMPELDTRYGYFVVLAVIVTTCAALYALLRRRNWL